MADPSLMLVGTQKDRNDAVRVPERSGLHAEPEGWPLLLSTRTLLHQLRRQGRSLVQDPTAFFAGLFQHLGETNVFDPRLGGPFYRVGSPIIDLPIVMPIRRSFLAISAARKVMFGMQQAPATAGARPTSRGHAGSLTKSKRSSSTRSASSIPASLGGIPAWQH
jgi:hypothetical protein